MKTLIVATSKKPPNFDAELSAGQRYRLEYLELSQHLNASFMDYDPPSMHEANWLRKFEERFHFDIFWAREIAKKVKQENYDVVISMSERVAVPLAYLLDKDVYHIAILINALAFKWLTFLKIQKTHQRWDKIVTYCKAEADALQRELNLRPNHVLPIHGYVDADFFEPLPKQERAERPFVLSQGLAKRDYPTLIRAMETLPEVACHISAVSAWDNFKGGYEGMRIPQNVYPIKYDHPSFIRDTFGKCEFVVIPLKPHVGMWCAGSTSILQAQAMGKAVIATYLPGLAEYMQDGETGFLVEGNNPAALAKKIDFLWRNPDKAAEMGRRGQEWVTKTFTLDKWMHKISDLINQRERVPAV